MLSRGETEIFESTSKPKDRWAGREPIRP